MAAGPHQRWQSPPPDPTLAAELAERIGLHPLLAQVLLNRGISSLEAATVFLDPSRMELPDPHQDFPDLILCVNRLAAAIQAQEPMAICGDYDADGMTSTALLIRALRHFGARVNYEIPSRMTEGYGINTRIVEDLHAKGVGVIITVDNGIAALEPITLAKELGLSVLVTDHHDLPPQLPPADGILNPKLVSESSPYRGLAGVGVAYLLALALADQLGDRLTLERPLLELLTLGTIADMAPLTGVNRKLIRQGLQLLPSSQILGIQALLKVSGRDPQASLQPETVGFCLGPRINAVGRLAQPKLVIELLTTEDPQAAMDLAQACENLNRERQHLCQQIEGQALEVLEQAGRDLKQDRVVVVLGQGWHHGVIGIVASRLLERLGAPVFIGSQEGEEIRGSARGIPEFNVFEALETCRDLFLKHGGHPAAGGFSMKADQWPALAERLRQYGATVLDPGHIQPLVRVDVEASLQAMTHDLFDQIQRLQPCGIGNEEPVFWSRDLYVARQTIFGKDRSHLKVQVRPSTRSKGPQGSNRRGRSLTAVIWRGAIFHPLPTQVDLAYTLQAKPWKGEVELELDVKGVRPAQTLLTQPSLEALLTPSSESSSSSDPQGQTAINPKLVVMEPRTSAQSTDPPAVPPQMEPDLIYRASPSITWDLQWHDLSRLSVLLPTCQGTALLYGYRRPQIHTGSLPQLTLHYDRPQSGQLYDYILLWSWPPSITHLSWILHLAQPAGAAHQIYVHQQVVPLVAGDTLRRQLRSYLEQHQQVDLLRLAQQWWMAPSTLVAGLRSLGFKCDGFSRTGSVDEELQKLERWYSQSWTTTAALLQDRLL